MTSNDRRVRESHRARNGVTFRWDDPPDEEPYDGHPGMPIQCRRRPRPVVPSVESLTAEGSADRRAEAVLRVRGRILESAGIDPASKPVETIPTVPRWAVNTVLGGEELKELRARAKASIEAYKKGKGEYPKDYIFKDTAGNDTSDIDELLAGSWVEDKDASGVFKHPFKPAEEVIPEWVEENIQNKFRKLARIASDGVATRLEGHDKLDLASIRSMRYVHFRLGTKDARVIQAVERELRSLRREFPDWRIELMK